MQKYNTRKRCNRIVLTTWGALKPWRFLCCCGHSTENLGCGQRFTTERLRFGTCVNKNHQCLLHIYNTIQDITSSYTHINKSLAGCCKEESLYEIMYGRDPNVSCIHVQSINTVYAKGKGLAARKAFTDKSCVVWSVRRGQAMDVDIVISYIMRMNCTFMAKQVDSYNAVQVLQRGKVIKIVLYAHTHAFHA